MIRIYRGRVKPWKKTMARRLRRHQTICEAIIWQQVRGKRFGMRIHRQHIILGYIVDFYCPKKGVVIEIDGGYHWNTIEYDNHRQAAIESLGLTFIRFTNLDVLNNLPDVLNRIQTVLLGR